ncbi:MAG: phosphate ABC transporter substrate-binding protein PstS [Hyphomonadaceae bacterium]|nr:phosphate ABC transporter substrate-binding protein PstS [Hyphomonadaceae bacterium]
MGQFNPGRLIAGLVAMAAAATLTLANPALAQSRDITGAGATFPAPIYMKWAEQYAESGGGTLNYQAVGSGAGVTQIVNRTVDFGASDSAVATARLSSQNLLQFPAVVGGVVMVVNIPGVNGDNVRLTGPIVADIYLGRVRLWNDPKIAALNPGIRLPLAAIAPAYRADSSGTTNIFTDYLAKVSPEFKERIGAGNSVAWRAGIGAPGNAGVAGVVKNIRGGIGYVEYAYASENNMRTAMLQNASGRFVRPSMTAIATSAASVDWAKAENLAVNMNNTVGPDNWPIVGATYILVPKNPPNAERSRAVLRFFDWAFRSGQPAAEELHYVMLPPEVHARVRESWAQVRFDGRPVWTPARP